MVIFNFRKKGWMRLLEVFIAITLLTGVLLYYNANNAQKQDKMSGYIYSVQVDVLDELARNSNLRNYTLNVNASNINDPALTNLSEYFRSSIPSDLNFSFNVCYLNVTICGPLQESNVVGDVYVEERMISSTLDKYDPRVVRLFVWPVQG